MPTNYVMVDFENTQPESLDELPVGAFKIKVFVGAAQAKARARTRFFISMHRHAAFSEYVEMARSGPNALDMHIAYYVGRLLATEPDASVFIVSNDKDFDPIVEHVHKTGSHCTRVKSIAEIVKLQAATRVSRSATAAPRAKVPVSKPPAAKTPASKAPAVSKPPPKTPSVKAPPATARAPAAAPAPARKKSAPNDIDAVVALLRRMKDKPGKRKALAQTVAKHFADHGGARGDKAIEQTIEELLRRGLISLDGTKVRYTLDF